MLGMYPGLFSRPLLVIWVFEYPLGYLDLHPGIKMTLKLCQPVLFIQLKLNLLPHREPCKGCQLLQSVYGGVAVHPVFGRVRIPILLVVFSLSVAFLSYRSFVSNGITLGRDFRFLTNRRFQPCLSGSHSLLRSFFIKILHSTIVKVVEAIRLVKRC